MGYVREYRDGDAEYLAPRLRTDDRREVEAATGLDPLAALRLSAEHSGILCTICTHDHVPAGVFGVVPTDDLTGVVWLLGSDVLTQPPLRRRFLVEGKDYFNRLHQFRPLLWNFVDERNTLHIRWLKWVGCTFINRHPEYGFEKRPFLEFVRII